MLRVILPMMVFVTALSSTAILAQEYPTRPVKIVVPFAPNGANDLIVRPYSPALQEALGGTVIIENRPGAGATIGANYVAKAAPDGYTILVGSFSFPINGIINPKLPYDPVRDFAPVSMMGKAPGIIVVNASLPVKSLADLIAYAKSRPGQLNYSITGSAATGTLAARSFQSKTGVQMKPIPYKGAGPGTMAVVSGEVHLSFPTIAPTIPLIRSGKIRALAVTGSKRSRLLPEVPTVAEAGVPGYEEGGWYGLLMPKGTPASIVSRVNKETVRILASAEIAQAYGSLGVDPVSSSPSEFAQFIKAEFSKWSKVLKPLQ